MTNRSNYPRACHGITVIELLMVVAVTMLIGAVGVSAFRTYVVRARIAESLALASSAETRVERAFRSTGLPPTDRHAAGLPAGADAYGDDVESIDVVNGRIEIRFGDAADSAIAGRTLSVTPFETADLRIVWICGNKVPGVGLNPLGFAGGASQAVQVLTTIEARYLPSSCR
jgi:type IV pilus assembly protein PilA